MVLLADFGLKLGLKLNSVAIFRETNFIAYHSLGNAVVLLAAISGQDFAGKEHTQVNVLGSFFLEDISIGPANAWQLPGQHQ